MMKQSAEKTTSKNAVKTVIPPYGVPLVASIR